LTLPRPVSEALLKSGVAADTIAWADDLYRHLGPPVVDALSELVEAGGLEPAQLRPEHLEAIRPMLGERYLRAHHGGWAKRGSSPAFWCERSVEGAVRGLVSSLGDVETADTPLLARVSDAARRAAGPDQPHPRGLLLFSQNAHRGNQEGTLAFDLVPADLEQALALNAGVGRHHTVPGSIGETSGRCLADPPLAILWEVQPNVYKPRGERNRGLTAAYRSHRCWPLVTAVAGLCWLRERGYRVFVLKGEALRAAHEVNPLEPLSPEIERMHETTMARAAAGLGLTLVECRPGAVPEALASLAKVNLGRAIQASGLHALVRELRP
jgi:hypothetical protein